jgi:hypothetical protein
VATHYPGGYAVEVTGARVVSTPGARILKLLNKAGATAVDVRVFRP